MSCSIILSIGKYGGFYITWGTTFKRVCFGWVAITVIKPEFDDTFKEVMEIGGVKL